MVYGVVMKQSDRINNMEKDINTMNKDIALIKQDLQNMKNNHLQHIESDMKKLDTRMWAVLLLLIASIIIPFVKSMW